MNPPNDAPDPAAALTRLRIDRETPRPRRRSLRLAWIAALAAIVAALAWWLAPATTSVQLVSVVTSRPSQQYAELTASGYVVAQRRAAVASKATGRLVWLGVREGSVVRKDEVIARIDASDVSAQVAVAKAGVAEAQAALDQARAGGRQARAMLEQARVEQDNAQADLQRVQQLVARGFVSPQAADAATARLQKAQAAVAAAVAAVSSSDAGLSVARAALEQARAQLQVQEVARDSTEIRAPFDGVVLVKNANVGDMITPFSQAAGSQGAVVTIADLGTLEVEADVSESNVARIRPEQPVEITLDAIPDAQFAGRVSRIVPTVDRAKATVTTKVRFEQIDPRVLPEMAARATFLSRPVGDEDRVPVLAVNPRAVVERDGASVLLRVRERDGAQVLEAVPVKTGRTLGELVEISGSLRAGDRVVLEPPAKLGPGARVSVAGR